MIIPNWSLDRYNVVRYEEDNFLSSFIFLLASCFLLGLAVARCAFELTVNNLLNNLMKSVQNLMTDWGLFFLSKEKKTEEGNPTEDSVDSPAEGDECKCCRDL